LVCAESAELIRMVENPAVTLHPLAFRGDLDLGFIPKLRQIIRRERPDLMHIHSRRGDGLAALAGRLEKIPLILSRRVDNPPRWLDLNLKFPLFKKIITISEGIRAVLLAAGVPAERVTCIPSAVDTVRHRPETERDWFRREFGLQDGQIAIGMIAQLIPRKGHDVLFDALPSVLTRHPKTRVLVFGRGPLEAELKQAVNDRSLDQAVIFAGFRNDLERVIPNLDLLVHPAWLEGLGVSLLEAAASGVPIVATRTGGIPEIVQDGVNGRLITPGDRQALTEAIDDLLEHPVRRLAFGDAGRRLAVERFAVGRMVEGNYRIYQSLLGLGRAGSPPVSEEDSL